MDVPEAERERGQKVAAYQAKKAQEAALIAEAEEEIKKADSRKRQPEVQVDMVETIKSRRSEAAAA